MQKDPDGPWLRFDQPLAPFVRHIHGAGLVAKSKQSMLETRQERKERRTTNKVKILFAVDHFMSRLEVSPLEDMTNGALPTAIQDIITTTGWATCKIMIDP